MYVDTWLLTMSIRISQQKWQSRFCAVFCSFMDYVHTIHSKVLEWWGKSLYFCCRWKSLSFIYYTNIDISVFIYRYLHLNLNKKFKSHLLPGEQSIRKYNLEINESQLDFIFSQKSFACKNRIMPLTHWHYNFILWYFF